MTCTIVGIILSCLVAPTPSPDAVRTLLAPYAAQNYLAVAQADGLHVYFMIPANPPPTYAPPVSVAPYLPPFLAYSSGGAGWPTYGGRRQGNRGNQNRSRGRRR